MSSRSPEITSPLPDDADYRYVARLMDLLREERNRQGLTKSGLCEKAGVGNGAVGRAERYDRFPTIPVLRRIVRALGLDWSEVCAKAEVPTHRHPL